MEREHRRFAKITRTKKKKRGRRRNKEKVGRVFNDERLQTADGYFYNKTPPRTRIFSEK